MLSPYRASGDVRGVYIEVGPDETECWSGPSTRLMRKTASPGRSSGATLHQGGKNACHTPAAPDSDQQDAPQPKGIYLVRDPSDSALAGLYESSNVILTSDRIDRRQS